MNFHCLVIMPFCQPVKTKVNGDQAPWHWGFSSNTKTSIPQANSAQCSMPTLHSHKFLVKARVFTPNPLPFQCSAAVDGWWVGAGCLPLCSREGERDRERRKETELILKASGTAGCHHCLLFETSTMSKEQLSLSPLEKETEVWNVLCSDPCALDL